MYYCTIQKIIKYFVANVLKDFQNQSTKRRKFTFKVYEHELHFEDMKYISKDLNKEIHPNTKI